MLLNIRKGNTMKISSKGEYALRALLALGQRRGVVMTI